MASDLPVETHWPLRRQRARDLEPQREVSPGWTGEFVRRPVWVTVTVTFAVVTVAPAASLRLRLRLRACQWTFGLAGGPGPAWRSAAAQLAVAWGL